jgi:hypothetical protein
MSTTLCYCIGCLPALNLLIFLLPCVEEYIRVYNILASLFQPLDDDGKEEEGDSLYDIGEDDEDFNSLEDIQFPTSPVKKSQSDILKDHGGLGSACVSPGSVLSNVSSPLRNGDNQTRDLHSPAVA